MTNFSLVVGFFFLVKCEGVRGVGKDSVPVVCERCDGLMWGCIVSDVGRSQEEDLSGGL